MSRHAPNLFGPNVLRGGHFESILNTIESSHLGDRRPEYAQAGMIWSQKVYADPSDTTSDVIAADLFLDSGTAGIPIGRFDFITDKLSLDATAREMFSAKRVARLMSNVNGGSYRMAGVILADHSLRGWGNNSYAQLGQGAWDATPYKAPVVIPGIEENAMPIKWVSSAYSHWVLFETGVIYVWGRNSFGELGVGHTAQVSLPQKVTGALDGLTIVDMSVGYSGAYTTACHVLLLTDDGRMFACGFNAFGQLGNGTTTTQNTFVEIGVGTIWAKIYAVGLQYGHSFAITTEGDLYAWGFNDRGQLGLGDTTGRNMPTRNPFFGGTGVDHVSSVMDGESQGNINRGAHALARLDNGTVYAWGSNDFGQLGTGNTTPYNVPQEIVALGTDNEQILAAGGYEGSSYVRKTGHTVYSAGYNGRGALGRADTTDQNTFGEVTGAQEGPIEQMLVVGDTSYQALFLRYANGRVQGCGYNGNGQLGIGPYANATTLKDVPLNTVQFKAVEICAVGTSAEAALGLLTEAGQYLQTGPDYGVHDQSDSDSEDNVGVPRLITF